MGDRVPWIVRTGAVVLAIGIAAHITGEVAGNVRRPPGATFLRALGVVLALHVGLLLAPKARGWGRLLAGALMTPGALIYFGFVGQQITRVVRGYPVDPASTTIFVAGTALNLWQYVWLGLGYPKSRRLTGDGCES